MSQAEIDRMVKEAAKFENEDREHRAIVEAKAECENYAYSVASSMEEPLMQEKLSIADKERLSSEIEKVLNWTHENETATKYDFERKKKELEFVVNPMMNKLYSEKAGRRKW